MRKFRSRAKWDNSDGLVVFRVLISGSWFSKWMFHVKPLYLTTNFHRSEQILSLPLPAGLRLPWLHPLTHLLSARIPHESSRRSFPHLHLRDCHRPRKQNGYGSQAELRTSWGRSEFKFVYFVKYAKWKLFLRTRSWLALNFYYWKDKTFSHSCRTSSRDWVHSSVKSRSFHIVYVTAEMFLYLSNKIPSSFPKSIQKINLALKKNAYHPPTFHFMPPSFVEERQSCSILW